MSDKIISLNKHKKQMVHKQFYATAKTELASFTHANAEMVAYEKINTEGYIEGYEMTFCDGTPQVYNLPFWSYIDLSEHFISGVNRAFDEEVDNAPIYQKPEVLDYTGYGDNVVPLLAPDKNINDGVYEILLLFSSANVDIQVSGKADGSRYFIMYQTEKKEGIQAFYETLAALKEDFMKVIYGYFSKQNMEI